MVESRPEDQSETPKEVTALGEETKKEEAEKQTKRKMGGQMQQKLYEVIKALSAMRLCKEDNVPNAILSRRVEPILPEQLPFVPSMPTAGTSTSEIASLVLPESRGPPCLFQGSIGTAYNKKSLQDNGITHILTAAANIGQRYKEDFQYKQLNLLDSPNQNIVKFLDETAEWIDDVLRSDPAHRVLIHCFAGKSRATTITCAYLMRKQGLTLREALLHVRACRPIAFPNIGFLVQLKAYEATIFGSCSDVPLKLEKLFGIAELPKTQDDLADQAPGDLTEE